MNNITKWLNSISEEDFADICTIRDTGECSKCPAKQFCYENESDARCEYIFYQWAISKGGQE